MPNRTFPLLRSTALAAALALAACGTNKDEGNLAGLDNSLVGNDVDPALTSALQDQIAVDPALANQSNRNAARTAPTPRQAQYPTQAARGRTVGGDAAAGCSGGAQFDYDAKWAGRFSAAFPAYPGWRVTEAAGNNQGDCRMRVVTFRTGDAPQRVLDWYRNRAAQSGYSAEQQARGGDQVLAGTNEGDGGAFYLIVTPQRGATDVALIANNGR
jgi:hypothetical protein